MRLVTEEAVFRANSDYDIVLLDRLAPAERKRLQACDDSGELYGALVPRPGSTLEAQAVSSETALLVFTLATAGPLPRYVVERVGEDAERTIRRLVLDGVLEVLHEGRFHSGPSVAELLASGPSSTEETVERNLAVAALQYGQELVGLGQAELAVRLYLYGRKPISPQLSRLGDARGVARHLGVAHDGAIGRRLGKRWAPAPLPAGADEHWWQWIAPTAARDRLNADHSGFKLYVSPAVDELRMALEVLAEALSTARGVTGLKVAVGVAGMCRPDKVIVYFTHFDDLRATAHALEAGLSGCPAHGVPFTAAVTPDALLSWGADPPRPPEPSLPTSWRMWVVDRLAEHLVAARSAELATLEPWQFALERLRLGGIDTTTWIPAGDMWPEALAVG